MHARSMRGYVVLAGDPGWGFLGALTPDQAAEQIVPSTATGWPLMIRQGTVSDIKAGQLLNAQGQPDYVPGTGQCSASGQSSNVKLAQMAGGLALTGVNAAAMASASVMAAVGGAAILGAATLGIGALIGLFPLLFNHHAAAVRKEQSILCSAVPAANNYLQIIEDAVRTGKATPQQGIDALSSLLSDFNAQVAPISQGTTPAQGKSCNAACVTANQLKAIVLYKQSQYQDLAAQQAQPASSGPSTAAPVTSGSTMTLPVAATPAQAAAAASSSWLPIAAVVLVGFFLVRGM